MQALSRAFGALHVLASGEAAAPAVVFSNSLGTDLRLWDKVVPLMPSGLRIIRYDKRGHGLSQGGGGQTIEDHRDDAIAVIEAFASGPVVFVGISIGGLIAQAVASHRPDLVRALVLSNTGVKLGTTESWDARIAAVKAGGVDSIADAVMERWFAAPFRASPELTLWRQMLANTPDSGYIAACSALAGTDQHAATSALRCPALVIGGSDDGASPPALVRAAAAVIAGATYHEISGAGHLPCVETPQAWAAIVAPFVKAQCHV